ncbi:MAG TPA: hypothetical protein VKE22_12625 [Haliangiales bacterium]|nr:hypothetical protein [Haliangiales bacterium]
MTVILEERSRLYDGLYDGSSERTPVRSGSPVKLLNPGFNVGDATSRRFALLEIE